jgi:hypothetical protein
MARTLVAPEVTGEADDHSIIRSVRYLWSENLTYVAPERHPYRGGTLWP